MQLIYTCNGYIVRFITDILYGEGEVVMARVALLSLAAAMLNDGRGNGYVCNRCMVVFAKIYFKCNEYMRDIYLK